MPVSVKTYPTLNEAAAALSSDRGARYLGGGTLVMRALNEGDVGLTTIVRASDRALDRRPGGAQHGHGRRQSLRALALRRSHRGAARARRDRLGAGRLRRAR